MSRLIELQDRLKREAAAGLLTPSQLICRQAIEERLRYGGILALWGASGSGKTYLAWALAATGASYVSLPERLPVEVEPQALLIIDNCQSSHDAVRDMLRRLALAGARRALLVMRFPPGDDVHHIRLTCGREDLAAASDVLSGLGLPAIETTPGESDLRSLVRTRGGLP